MKFKHLTSETLSEKVINEFENMIETGKLKPGEKLPSERMLAEQMGVSRGILREALRTIESKGYITRKPGGGTFVRKLVKEQFVGQKLAESLKHATYLDLLELREVLECKAVELSVLRATDEDIKQIESTLKTDEDMESDSELDRAFHLAIASATKNVLIENIMIANFDLMKEITVKTHKDPKRVKQMREEHKNIFNAIRDRDSVEAQRAMLQHLFNIRKAIKKVYKELEDKKD